MKLTRKKGFTIVELVIVIAVIAVLAAVLVPTFSNLIKKASISADAQLAKNLNTALTMNQVTGEKPTSMGEVLRALEKEGFILKNLNPTTAGYYYGWDSGNNQMVLISDTWAVHYATNPDLKTNEVYVLVADPDHAQALATVGYSLYLAADVESITAETFINVDTGINKLEKLILADSIHEREITLRGSIGTLEVNSANGSVEQYASVTNLTITSIANESYHIYGSVKTVVHKAGRLVVEPLGLVENLETVATVVNKGIIGSVNGSGKVTTDGGLVGSADGQEIIIPIDDYNKLIAFRDQVNNGRHFEGITVKLTKDIDVSGQEWTPIGNDTRDYEKVGSISEFVAQKYFSGTFDGDGHKIVGLSSRDASSFISFANKSTANGYQEFAWGFFGIVKDATIKNVTFENVDIDLTSAKSGGNTILGDSVGAIVGFAFGTEFTMEYCAVSGSVKGFDCVAGLVGACRVGWKFGEDGSVSIANCTNKATVVGSRRVAGIVIYSSTAHGDTTLSIKNSTNNGAITSLNNEDKILGNINDKETANPAYHMAAGVCYYNGDKQVWNSTDLGTCSNTGKISVTNNHCDGIFMYNISGCLIKADTNSGYKTSKETHIIEAK